ncbi:MAG: hypothetical protein COB60_04230 [Flavobacteriaceae bacterium]|nr:MAG: hypothetical protein COB60_04230 [Flavobacteriaceae bacterium]
MQQKTTKKENQHYVPKFYLKYFSIENNKKTIGIYNERNKLFVPSTKLENQASEKYFYGKDGIIEDWLSTIESLVAPIFSNILKTQVLPRFQSTTQVDILFFLILLDLRNPIRKKNFKRTTELLKERILEVNPDNKNSELFKAIELSELKDETHQRNLLNTKEHIPYLMDLHFKLIKNNSNKPFIISDNPLINYNQFLEKIKWKFGSHNGYGIIGKQLFFPLSDEYMLIFYDSNIYKVGNKREKIVIFDDEKSIDQLNILQYLNSDQNIYFNNKATKFYIENLINKAKKYNKANDTLSEVFSKIEDNGNTTENDEIIFFETTDLKINLTLPKIKLLSKSKGIVFDDKIVQLRPRVKEYRKYKKER